MVIFISFDKFESVYIKVIKTTFFVNQFMEKRTFLPKRIGFYYLFNTLTLNQKNISFIKSIVHAPSC